MEVTEVRIKLMDEAGDRLQAFCSITFDDCFVIRDLKIIGGSNGPFVAMPSRKLTARCTHCGSKNHLRALHCNQCGHRLREDRAIKDENGRAKLYADIAHPINSRCREMIQERIIQAFREEQSRAKLPGYVSTYDDFDEGEDYWHEDPPAMQPAAPHARMEVTRPGHRPRPAQSGGPHITSNGPATSMSQAANITSRADHAERHEQVERHDQGAQREPISRHDQVPQREQLSRHEQGERHNPVERREQVTRHEHVEVREAPPAPVDQPPAPTSLSSANEPPARSGEGFGAGIL